MVPFTLARLVLLALVIAAVAPGVASAQAPVDDNYVWDEDSCGCSLFLTLNDPTGAQIESFTQPPNGMVTLLQGSGNSTVIYVPDENYCNEPGPASTDDFTYKIVGQSDPADVAVTVMCKDDPPKAFDDDTPSVLEDSGAVVHPVLANDTDAESDPIEITGVSAPAGGDVTASVVQGTGGNPDKISVTPKPNRAGSENVMYTINGGDTAFLFVDITDQPDRSFANDDTRTLAFNTGTAFIDVLSNDVDADTVNYPDEIPILSVTQPGNGSTRIVEGSGAVAVDKIAYTPKPGTCGTDSFTYTVDNDLPDGTDTATVTIAVSCAIPAVPIATATATAKAGKLKVSGTTLKVPLRCGKAAKCAVSLRLTSKKTVLGKAKATLKAGQKKTVTLKLNKAGKRKLKKSRRLKAKLKITLGGKTVATRTVKFKAKRKKR